MKQSGSDEQNHVGEATLNNIGETEDSFLALNFSAYIFNTHCPKSMQYISKQNIHKCNNILVTICKTKGHLVI